MKKSLFSLALLGSTALSFGVPMINGEVSIGGMSQDPSGYIQYPAGTGTPVDVEKTLGLDKETKFFARAKLEIPIIPNLYVQYIPMKFSGVGRYTDKVRFGNVEFQANIDLNTTVKLDHYDVGLYYNLPFISTATAGILDPELGVNVRIIDFEGKITGREVNTNTVRTETKTATIPIPMAYVGLGVNLPYIKLVGELRGITYSGHRYYDLMGEVRVKPLSIPALASFFIGVGYRYEELKLDNLSDINAKLKVKGPFIHGGISF